MENKKEEKNENETEDNVKGEMEYKEEEKIEMEDNVKGELENKEEYN